uniref:AIG1-type G domain-containing protein n=1 Tax=Myripristis murdjan TaxID=586833 RepID=A0A667WVM7_9TELE
ALCVLYLGEFLHLPEVRIVLLGWKYGGKSSAANTILGKKEFKLKESIQCQSRQGEVAGRKVTVVKAPGWWRDIKRKYTPKLVEQEIVLSASMCPPGPHAVLVVLDLGCQFLYKKSLVNHIQLLGESVWNHAIVLFTFGDNLGGRSIEQYVHSEGETLQWLIGQCGNRYHVFNNKDWDDCSQVTELLEKIDKMVAGNKGVYISSSLREQTGRGSREEGHCGGHSRMDHELYY